MASIISWKRVKPGTMLGGKGVLIPYIPDKQKQSDSPREADNTKVPPDPSKCQIHQPDSAAQHKERSAQIAAAFVENLNRNAMESEASKNKFGCEDCWPEDPDAAWSARYGLSRVAELIDESHYHVMVMACLKCGQRFLSVFTEIVDWKDGEDPQFWTLLPITEAETEMLIRKGNALTERELNKLGPGRRSLLHDNPKEKPRKIKWGMGIWVGMHD